MMGVANSSPTQDAHEAAGHEAILRDIDRAICDDVDDLLRGEFQTVEEALDGVFEEQAEAFRADDMPIPEPIPDLTAEPLEAIEGAASDLDVISELVATETVATIEAEIDSATVDEQTVEETVAAEVIRTPEPPAANAVTDADREPEPAAAPEPEPDPVPNDVETDVVVEPTQPPMQRFVEGVNARIASVVADVHKGLQLVNAPVRLLPKGLRRVVDIVAITLAAWVPVVWALVMLLG